MAPKAADHASRIRVMHNLMKSNEELKNFYNEKVEEYFGNLARKALEEYYEKLVDVSLFDRTDIISSFRNLRHRLTS